jgi:S-methylmethionine-dependent homocysteine/selenocysteine methylase
MAKYRRNLPQLSGDLFLTDGGIETTMIFHEGLELPYLAAFDLLKNEQGREVLRNYFRTHAEIARKQQTGFVLESATWRASPDWAGRIGYTPEELADLNRQSIELLEDIRAEYENAKTSMVISGCIGPRGDGYNPAEFMTAAEAKLYHSTQANIFSETNADMITAITMTYAEEAIGLTRAAKATGMPVAISFTVETDGRLPSGQTLRDAIEQVDAATAETPVYYMINCAHPTISMRRLRPVNAWPSRFAVYLPKHTTSSKACTMREPNKNNAKPRYKVPG